MNEEVVNEMIEINFDMRLDSRGKDPDSASKTLKQYHKILWSKNLPNGRPFILDDTVEKAYLYHKSELGEFYLASDSLIHTYYRWKRYQHIITQIPQDIMMHFYDYAYTIGGFILFPGNRVGKANTMNQERGMNKRINDRIDLTLECIRRYYNGNEDSPLKDTINLYSEFFDLFHDLKGYCEYFLLQDLVNENYTEINFFLPFNGFVSNPLPKDVEEYHEYRIKNLDFLKRRISRIEQYCISQSTECQEGKR